MTDKLKIKQNCKQGYAELTLPGVFDAAFPSSKTRRGRVICGGGICNTITAEAFGVVYVEKVEDILVIDKSAIGLEGGCRECTRKSSPR